MILKAQRQLAWVESSRFWKLRRFSLSVRQALAERFGRSRPFNDLDPISGPGLAIPMAQVLDETRIDAGDSLRFRSLAAGGSSHYNRDRDTTSQLQDH